MTYISRSETLPLQHRSFFNFYIVTYKETAFHISTNQYHSCYAYIIFTTWFSWITRMQRPFFGGNFKRQHELSKMLSRKWILDILDIFFSDSNRSIVQRLVPHITDTHFGEIIGFPTRIGTDKTWFLDGPGETFEHIIERWRTCCQNGQIKQTFQEVREIYSIFNHKPFKVNRCTLLT